MPHRRLVHCFQFDSLSIEIAHMLPQRSETLSFIPERLGILLQCGVHIHRIPPCPRIYMKMKQDHVLQNDMPVAPQESYVCASQTQTMFVCRHADKACTHPLARLSLIGERQSVELGAELHTISRGLSCVFSSPYHRCLQTASAIVAGTSIPICVENGLSEGPCHVPGKMLQLWESKHLFPAIDTSYRSILDEPRHERTQMDVMPRCALVGGLLTNYLKDRNITGDIAVVTHGTVVLGLTGSLTRMSHTQRLPGSRPAGFFALSRTIHMPLHTPEFSAGAWQCKMECQSEYLSMQACTKSHSSTPICYLTTGAYAVICD